MSPETIEQIAQAMSNLGDDAKAGFITWVIVQGLQPVLAGLVTLGIWALVVGCVLKIANLIVYGFNYSSSLDLIMTASGHSRTTIGVGDNKRFVWKMVDVEKVINFTKKNYEIEDN